MAEGIAEHARGRALVHHPLEARTVRGRQVVALAELHPLVEERAERQVEELLGLELRGRLRAVPAEERVALLLQPVEGALPLLAHEPIDGLEFKRPFAQALPDLEREGVGLHEIAHDLRDPAIPKLHRPCHALLAPGAAPASLDP
jgi:hypothetical protein